MTANKRGPWSVHEDSHLRTLVGLHGAHSWTTIASALASRTPKQCRERWHQNLDPRLDHTSIRPEEGQLIDDLVREMGKRWAEIARRLPGRSDNAVKNWWNGGLNRRHRLWVRHDLYCGRPASEEQAQPSQHRGPGLRITQQPLSIPHYQQQVQTPQPSPIGSETSIPDSSGEAPSLISDHSSHVTLASPRGNIHTQQRQVPLPDRSPPDARNGAKYREHYNNSQLAAHQSGDVRFHPEQLVDFRRSSVCEQRLQRLSEVASNQPPSSLHTSFAPSLSVGISSSQSDAEAPTTRSEIGQRVTHPCATTPHQKSLHSSSRPAEPQTPYYSPQNFTHTGPNYRYPSPEALDRRQAGQSYTYPSPDAVDARHFGLSYQHPSSQVVNCKQAEKSYRYPSPEWEHWKQAKQLCRSHSSTLTNDQQAGQICHDTSAETTNCKQAGQIHHRSPEGICKPSCSAILPPPTPTDLSEQPLRDLKRSPYPSDDSGSHDSRKRMKLSSILD